MAGKGRLENEIIVGLSKVLASLTLGLGRNKYTIRLMTGATTPSTDLDIWW